MAAKTAPFFFSADGAQLLHVPLLLCAAVRAVLHAVLCAAL